MYVDLGAVALTAPRPPAESGTSRLPSHTHLNKHFSAKVRVAAGPRADSRGLETRCMQCVSEELRFF